MFTLELHMVVLMLIYTIYSFIVYLMLTDQSEYILVVDRAGTQSSIQITGCFFFGKIH